MNIKQAYFAGGCFWGVEYYFQQENGVVRAISGYMGGVTPSPSYKEVSTGLTGHLEVVKVEYDDAIISFEELSKLFFEIHDFTQTNGQGPDIGSQYLSAIFYNTEEEKVILKDLIKQLEAKGYRVATSLISTLNTPFFEAEEYHQDYYFKTGKNPYCHSKREIF
ncbi:MAG: peptide-methionine (S)-S-oxide reductase MsrA [Arcobacteraceae bacterium]